MARKLTIILAAVLTIASLVIAGPSRAAPIIWYVTSTGQIGKVDIATCPGTCAATVVGNTGNTTLRDLAFSPDGLTLYAVGQAQMYKVNQTTGALTALTSPLGSGLSTGTGAGSSSGSALVVAKDGTIYMASRSGANDISGSLYTVNSTTGVATLKGLLGAASGANTVDSSGDLMFAGGAGNGTLYLSGNLGNAGNSRLFTVNTSTGAATRVNATNTLSTADDLYGLANGRNGVFYGIQGGTTSIYSINLTTGLSVLIDNITGVTGTIYGAAVFGEAAPEPASLALLGTGLLGLWAARRRRAA